MAEKGKKIPSVAHFRNEDGTPDGKPKKKNEVDDSENTGEINIPVQKISDKPKEENSVEDKKTPAESQKAPAEKKKNPPANKKEEDPYKDWILSKESARIVSVIMFATGILLELAAIIPGVKGWGIMHNGMLGLFGFMAFVVPVEIIYISVKIGQYLKKTRNTIMWCIASTFVICAAIEVFFVGTPPDDGIAEYMRVLLEDGEQYRGGGAVSALFAGPLLAGFGRMGASIVIVLMIFVVSVLFSGKELNDLLYAVLHPIETSGKIMDKIASFFISDDEEDNKDNKDDKDDKDNKISKDSKNDKYKQDNQNKKDTSYSEDDREEETDGFNIHMPSDNYADALETLRNTPKPIPAVTDSEMNEQDELSVIFGDDDNFRSSVPEPLPKNPKKSKKKENENTSELDKLISREAEKKQIQDNSVPVRNTEKPDSDIPEKKYQLPDIELLTKPDNFSNSAEAAAEMREKADKIVNTFKSFGVEVSIKDIYRGPTITRYEIQPGVGVKVSKIRGLEDDIALSLAAHGVRIEAPVPGKAAVGIEVPNVNKDTVTLHEILQSSGFRNAESKLAFAVGKDITGNAIIGDITKMPHVIIAGTTGSGKSVCTRSIIMSILYNAKPDEVKMILIDPKVVEFKVFENLPHLLIPIVTDVKKAAGALNWAVNEMMRRYNTFADSGVNDLKSYNEFAKEEEISTMPQVVVFIDELADMMLVAGKDVEDSICRLAQMGRAAGIHLVVATQRPTTDVITGLIKANIPSRIALSVKSQIDSRTIIDMGGADKLLGNGDMLYMPIGVSKPVRIQGCFASSKDINKTLDFIRSQATGEYDQNILDAVDNFVPQTKGDHGSVSESGFDSGSDEDYIVKGAEVAVNAGQVSTTLLQRKLKLGYARASRIMDALEERGIVGPAEGAKPRKVLMSKLQYDEWKMRMIENR